MRFLLLWSVFMIIRCGLCRAEDADTDEYPVIDTPLGTIEGLYNTSSGGQIYEAYLGIPYAVPMTEAQRFEVAEPVEPWTGVLSAKTFSSVCLQIDITSIALNNPTPSGSEDCLYLNVYTPAERCRNVSAPSTDFLPVIIFIHGGAFQFGSGSVYGPDFLLDERVILVTFNYRLGPLGFLSTEDGIIPGNMGLKDQVVAMRWVKDNILYFGGNPENITIIGQSAGGVSVHYHYLTNLTEGLFQRGMSISGNALNSWALSEANLEKAKKIATLVGCPSSDVQDMVDCLKSQPGENITQAAVEFMPWVESPFAPFGPVVEAEVTNSSFINQEPIQLITSGKVHDLPWITTSVSQEGLFPLVLFVANATRIEELNNNWEDIAPYLLDYNFTIPESEKSNVSQLIREHYIGDSSIDESTIGEIVRMVGDRLFTERAGKAAKLQAAAMENPVRFYYFSYRGNHSTTEVFTGTATNYGVMHIDDLAYVLNSYFDPTTTPQDLEMQEFLINIWVSFATFGVPNVGVEWSTVDPEVETLEYLHIAAPDDIAMNASLNFGNTNFWETIPFEENSLS